MYRHYNISKYELDYIFTSEFYTSIHVCWQGCSLQLFLVKWSLRLVLPDQMMPLAGIYVQVGLQVTLYLDIGQGHMLGFGTI